MAKPNPMQEAKIQAFMDTINKKYKENVVGRSSLLVNTNLKRFSSLVLPLDLALGGGWCFNRIQMMVGDYSTGKSVLATYAFKSVQQHCKYCRLHQTRCKCPPPFTPCLGLYIDQEGSFDLAWGKKIGFDDEFHALSRPEYAEQTIDMVDAAVRSGAFDLICIDSIAAMTPKVEIENSSEDQQMGVAARLLNKAFRRWQSSLNVMDNGPAIMCINQPREKIGVMFGSPIYYPGGKGQLFASSIILNLKGKKITDDAAEATSAWVEFGGTAKKNKTFTPALNYTWNMALKEVDGYKAGEPDNPEQLAKLGEKYGFVSKVAGQYQFDSIATPTQKAFISQIQNKPDLARKLWRSIVNKYTGMFV